MDILKFQVMSNVQIVADSNTGSLPFGIGYITGFLA